jgi:glycosyltransferase involved in cell wall biosynthesis
MRLLTNFPRFPEHWCASTGETGTAQTVDRFEEFIARVPDADVVLVNCDVNFTLKLCMRFAMQPWLRKPLVASDVVLRRPENARAQLSTFAKKMLFRQVDWFVHHFKDLGGFERYYGIGPDRSTYVPFKPNLRNRYDVQPREDGDYIVCLGRSLRDYDTFLAAVEKTGLPAAITKPNFEELREHRSRFTRSLDQLPSNVRILEDDGSDQSMIRILSGAKLVALPVLKESICASGISVYLNSMLLGKCVILSEGPGSSDILRDEALFVPPEDPGALASMMERAWNDDALRLHTARTALRYAVGLGGEADLRQRILDAVVAWHQSR